MKSVHKGDLLSYSCTHKDCKKKPHTFTRADNLNQHLATLDGKGWKRKDGEKGKKGKKETKGTNGTKRKTGAQ